MATRENAPQNNGENTVSTESKPWVQPTRYATCSTDDMGFFVQIPHLPPLVEIAEKYGPKMADVWFRAAERLFTYIGQSITLPKDAPKTREAIQAAMEAEFAKFADGSLTWKEKRSIFDTKLLDAARPTLMAALEKAGKGPEYLDRAFDQYYNALVERFGPAVAAAGYTPMKKGAGGKKAEDVVELELAL